jgi:cysteine desulfurase
MCIRDSASSVHSFGREARSAIDRSREIIAKFLNCQTTEIVFTSGGSESDNLAIRGLVQSAVSGHQSAEKSANGKRQTANELIPHIITTAFEHHAVLNTVKELEREGVIEATYILPSKEGIIDPEDIRVAIKENTLLVSVMYVNNEIGTIQPIRTIGQMIEKINRERGTDNGTRIYFHTDAVQAAEYLPMDVLHLHVDLLTMTAHKIYGPKGVGLLYIKKGTPIKRLITGGEQEYRKRAGTENVPGIVGFATAVAVIASKAKQSENKIAAASGLAMTNSGLVNLRDKLINGILKTIPDSFLNGSREFRTPANANISFMNAEGESILLNLDMEGIAASTGSACTSGALEPSHVLRSLGLKPEQCHGSIRFTLGRHTTEAEIDHVLEVLPQIVEKLRKMSTFK